MLASACRAVGRARSLRIIASAKPVLESITHVGVYADIISCRHYIFCICTDEYDVYMSKYAERHDPIGGPCLSACF